MSLTNGLNLQAGGLVTEELNASLLGGGTPLPRPYPIGMSGVYGGGFGGFGGGGGGGGGWRRPFEPLSVASSGHNPVWDSPPAPPAPILVSTIPVPAQTAPSAVRAGGDMAQWTPWLLLITGFSVGVTVGIVAGMYLRDNSQDRRQSRASAAAS